MLEESSQKRSLSEISHLFLSGVRDRHTNGAPRPHRIPPKKSDVSIDMTPEEFAQIWANASDDEPASGPEQSLVHAPPVTAVLVGSCQAGRPDPVKDYARHLASRVGRVGLVELDASTFQLMCFDPADVEWGDQDEQLDEESYDVRQMADAMAEMNCDVDHWLVLARNPRTPEARALLRQLSKWVLLSTCDHDGIVSSYRLLKGMADVSETAPSGRPELSLVLLDARDQSEADRVYQKLNGVCQQFLSWPMRDEAFVRPMPSVAEHMAMSCRPTRDKAQLASAPQWELVAEFFRGVTAAASANASLTEANSTSDDLPPALREAGVDPVTIGDFVVPAAAAAVTDVPAAAPPVSAPSTTAAVAVTPAVAPATTFPRAADAVVLAASRETSVKPKELPMCEVLELTSGDTSATAVLDAVLRQTDGGLIECPVRPPVALEGRLAVTRDRELVLLAVAHQGLQELREIGQAYRWVTESRALIAMALPQFAIDAKGLPRLRLLVDHSDSSAQLLQPMLQSEHVTVQAYRRLRWGEKTGLLLEAA